MKHMDATGSITGF